MHYKHTDIEEKVNELYNLMTYYTENQQNGYHQFDDVSSTPDNNHLPPANKKDVSLDPMIDNLSERPKS